MLLIIYLVSVDRLLGVRYWVRFLRIVRVDEGFFVEFIFEGRNR